MVASAGTTEHARPEEGGPVLQRLKDLAEEHGLRTTAHYARDENGHVARLDVVIFRADGPGIAESADRTAGPATRSGPLFSTPTALTTHTSPAGDLAEYLAGVLPRHMRPEQIIEVPAFPLNKTGKIDRAALLRLIPRQESSATPGQVHGDTEKRLAEILGELLGRNVSIDRESDFFAIGGHSLLATRYVHAVNQAFGVDLRVKSVFDRPKLRDFAELVASQPDERVTEATGGTGAPTDVLPLSPLQQRFWTMAQGSGPSTLYNSVLLLELTGRVAVDSLRNAFQRVVEHHSVLRSHFHDEAGVVTLRFRDPGDYPLTHIEVPGLDAEGAERLLAEQLNRPFDLASGPLLDAALFTATPDKHFLAMCVHHIIFDGASDAMLITDLGECYAADRENREPRWRDDGRGFLTHLAEVAQPDAEGREFWSRTLDGAPAVHTLPVERERAAGAKAGGASLRSVVPADTTALLAETARTYRTTPFVVLNALVGLFLSLVSGADDVVVGSPVDCRETQTDSSAMGMYINTVPFRHHIDWEQTLDDLIIAERGVFRDVFTHRTVPFDRIVEWVNPPRVPGANPIFQIEFALQPDGVGEFSFCDCATRSIKVETAESKFDLALNSRVVDGKLNVFWEYRQDLFSRERIERMAAFFESFLRTVLTSPRVPLAEHRFAEGDESPLAALLAGSARQDRDTTGTAPHDRARRGVPAGLTPDRPEAPAAAGARGAAAVMDRIRAIWQDVLDVPGDLPEDESFFSLGGNSLSLTRVLRRLNEEFGAEMTLDTVYRYSTLAEQAALMAARDSGPDPEPSDRAASAGEFDEVALTAAQCRFYLLEKLGSGADYVDSICFRIGNGIEPDRLVKAITALAGLHPILKSRVAERGDRLVMLPGADVPSDDCVGGVIPCDDAEEILDRMTAARSTVVNVFGGPLFKAFLYMRQNGAVHLQLLVHHIIFDGWSERVLLDDLIRLYQETAAGPTGPRQRPVPFQHYAARAAGHQVEAGTAWWVASLSGAPAAHNLPRPERAVPARPEAAPAIQHVMTGEALARLQGRCQDLGVTMFNVVHSALALAVMTMSHEDDVVIGVPTANKRDMLYQGTIGLFMETLPLRTTISGGDLTFGQIVRANQARLTDALEHADFRIEEVLNACAPHRDGKRNALYQIVLSVSDEGERFLDFAGARAERFHLSAPGPKLDLALNVKLVAGNLHFFWEHDTALLSAETVTALAGDFEHWLQWGVDQPDHPIRERDTAEPHREESDGPGRTRSVYERFTAAWDGRERETAFTDEDTRLTAGRLHGRVVAMAGRLAEQGVGRKSVVACHSQRVLDHVITFLAASRLGATHVPLDSSNPPGRTEQMLDLCDADVVVSDTPDGFAGHLGLSTAGLPEDIPVTPALPSRSGAISHIVFTSGTDGRPKGVQLGVGATDAYVTAINEVCGAVDAPVAQCGNPAYDFFVEEFALSLLAGNRMAVLPTRQKADPSAFARFVQREQIGVISLPTAYWAFLVGAMSGAELAMLRGLTTCLVGGEDYPRETAERWLEVLGGSVRLLNTYGPAENGPVTLLQELHRDTPPSSVGHPLGGVRASVRSRHGALVPAEGLGELWLSGPQLFSGYLGGTRAADHPTGDIVLARGERGYRFIERTGSTMKISGFRVEPGEYAAPLTDVPGIAGVRVAPTADRTGVFVYCLVDGTVPEEEISEAAERSLRAALPQYMRRHEVRFCREIPLTVNGKTDFTTLRETSWPAPLPDTGRPDDWPDVRDDVRAAWVRVLGAIQLDEDRDFFGHGGTSMSMLRLLARLNERFPKCFDLMDLYEKPSISLQARHAHDRLEALGTAGDAPGAAADVAGG